MEEKNHDVVLEETRRYLQNLNKEEPAHVRDRINSTIKILKRAGRTAPIDLIEKYNDSILFQMNEILYLFNQQSDKLERRDSDDLDINERKVLWGLIPLGVANVLDNWDSRELDRDEWDSKIQIQLHELILEVPDLRPFELVSMFEGKRSELIEDVEELIKDEEKAQSSILLAIMLIAERDKTILALDDRERFLIQACREMKEVLAENFVKPTVNLLERHKEALKIYLGDDGCVEDDCMVLGFSSHDFYSCYVACISIGLFAQGLLNEGLEYAQIPGESCRLFLPRYALFINKCGIGIPIAEGRADLMRLKALVKNDEDGELYENAKQMIRVDREESPSGPTRGGGCMTSVLLVVATALAPFMLFAALN